MIFIYPASVSETCDKRIVPAVAKCIERFFLTQIADAMSDNVIPLSRKYKGTNYGPILMECVNNYNKSQMLTEQKILSESTANENDFRARFRNAMDTARRADNIRDWNAAAQAYRDVLTDLNHASVGTDPGDDLTPEEARFLNRIADTDFREINRRGDTLERNRREDDRLNHERQVEQTQRNRDKIRLGHERHRDYRDRIRLGFDRNKDSRDATRLDLERARDARDEERLGLEKEKNTREWQRERRADELERKKDAREIERNARDFEEYADRRAGSGSGHFMPLDSKIDITPTTTTVWAPIMYNGGPLNGRLKEVELSISVKVIPTIIKNFKVLEKDMLDDAFTKKSEAFFKSRGRNIARHVYNVLKRLPFGMGDVVWKHGMRAVNGDDVERESRKDIIYNTHGFVNASAFHKSSNSPNNYNYTSNIVIFNKDDLTDPDDANIFQNRTAMVKLFKLGWSTFCMLDPVEEMMYFISSLDGGYMHPIPYRYIMESYGSRAYYGTEEKLKDSAKPFMIKRGNFSNFAKTFYKKRK